MNIFVWATVILAIWAAVGPLVGIYVGHHLLRSQQRRQWLADNRIQEWRELITTLNRSVLTIAEYDAMRVVSTAEEHKAHVKIRGAALEVLGNRLFIAEEVSHHKMFEKWSEAVKEFEGHHDAAKLGTLFGELVYLIRKVARAEISKL